MDELIESAKNVLAGWSDLDDQRKFRLSNCLDLWDWDQAEFLRLRLCDLRDKLSEVRK